MLSVRSIQQPNIQSPASITGERTTDQGMFSPPPTTTQEWVENSSLPLGELRPNDILLTGPYRISSIDTGTFVEARQDPEVLHAFFHFGRSQ